MANEILFVGGALDSVRPFAGAVEANTSDNGFWDTTYADVGTWVQNGANVIADARDSSGALATVVAGQIFCAHAEVEFTNAWTSGNKMFTLLDSSGNPWVSINSLGGGAFNNNFGIFYNSGTGASPVWTQVGATFQITQQATRKIDIEVAITASGVHNVNFYNDGAVGATATITGTFTQALLTNLQSLQLYSQNPSGSTVWTQIAITRGLSLVGAHVKYTEATAAGATSNWSGLFSDINEVKYNDANFLSASAVNDVSTFAWGDVGTIPAGLSIAAVAIWTRGRNNGGAAPQDFKIVCRSAGTDYASAVDVPGITTTFAPLGGLKFLTDPATGLQWTATSFNAAEFGVKATT
jgi:hypothetical protein